MCGATECGRDAVVLGKDFATAADIALAITIAWPKKAKRVKVRKMKRTRTVVGDADTAITTTECARNICRGTDTSIDDLYLVNSLTFFNSPFMNLFLISLSKIKLSASTRSLTLEKSNSYLEMSIFQNIRRLSLLKLYLI